MPNQFEGSLSGMIDDYKELELEAGASIVQIQAAYVILRRAWDPDNFAYSPRQQIEAEEKLNRVNEAYTKLRKKQTIKQNTQAKKEPLGAAVLRHGSIESPSEKSTPLSLGIPPNRTQSLIRSAYLEEIGGQAGDSSTSYLPKGYRPISAWMGERFVFILGPQKLQKTIYMGISRVNSAADKHLPYEEYVGRVAIVTSLTEDVEREAWEVELALEDSGEKVLVKTYAGTMRGFAPVADIEMARSSYVGKALWLSTSPQAFDEDGAGSLLSTGGRPVVVLDVIAGWDENKPVRFVIETLFGKKGLLDVIITGTNSRVSVRSKPFENVFKSAVRPTAQIGTGVIGNRRTSIYHLPFCQSSKKLAPRNRIMFSSRADAEVAGYRAGRNCNSTQAG